MKKYLYLFFCGLFLNLAFGQEIVLKKEIIGTNDSIGVQFVKLYVGRESMAHDYHSYYLQWNNGTDSIHIPTVLSFSEYEHNTAKLVSYLSKDTCIITAKQLDEKGLPEIIVEHYGEWEWVNTTIVNLDDRKIMFSAKNYSFVSYRLNTYYGNDRNNFSSCNYSYQLSFDENDHLLVHDLEQKGGLNPNPKKGHNYLTFGCHPDRKEGVYVLEDGIYVYSKVLRKRNKTRRK